MATTTIKSTYALDPETVRRLETMASEWRVSKSEALRRAIRMASGEASSEGAARKLAALEGLQQSVKLTEAEAARWAREARRERIAASGRARGRRR